MVGLGADVSDAQFGAALRPGVAAIVLPLNSSTLDQEAHLHTDVNNVPDYNNQPACSPTISGPPMFCRDSGGPL